MKAGIGLALAALAIAAQAGDWSQKLDDAFAIDDRVSKIGADDLGLINGHATFNGRMDDVALVTRLYAPPYFCHDFRLVTIFDRRRVKPTNWRWRPDGFEREGVYKDWKIRTLLVPLDGCRGGALRVEVTNAGASPATITVQFDTVGTVGSCRFWGFNQASSESGWKDGVFSLESQQPVGIAVAASTGKPENKIVFRDVPPGAARDFSVFFALAAPDEARAIVRRAVDDPAAAFAGFPRFWRERVRELASRMPELETDNAALKELYCRALIHFPLCRWESDAFILKPYYSTGGMNGGCVGNYLWNLGEPYKLWPLVDPEAMKSHLKTFLGHDILNCFAFSPVDGRAFGPYYPVNQEKVLRLIHAYVLETGDVGFLRESFKGKQMVEWAVEMALTHDDLTKPAVLADYGPAGRSHLELRKDYKYDGIMPDLNLRRIPLYYQAAELCRMARYQPPADLEARARALKALIRERLWDAENGWFVAICSDGQRTLRWPLDEFHAFGWGDRILDPDQKQALLKHLMNPDEFLGPYGIYSLSRKDPAWDDADIDHGGPGSCPSFAPEIACGLYRDGFAREAWEVMRRLLWLGRHYPYVGDSHCADRADYRRDTPLQCNIEGAVFAQAILFGTFGIDVRPDLSIVIQPHLPEGTETMALRGVRLAGQVFDVRCTRADGVSVTIDGRTVRADAQGRVILPPATTSSNTSAAWVKVSSFGFDPEDATAIVQKALDSGTKKILIDKAAGDWVVGPLVITNSNLRIALGRDVTIRAKRGLFKGLNDCLLRVENARDVRICGQEGARLVMNKRDYSDPAQGYSFSEWRHAIHIENARDVSVKNLALVSSGGDGIYVRSSDGVTLEGLRASDNHRQGISVIAAKDLTVRNCVFEQTGGAAPQCGLDIEPNRYTDYLENILFEDCVFRGNKASGILIHLSTLDHRTRPISILFRNCRAEGNGNHGVTTYSCTSRGAVTGSIRFENCSAAGNGTSPLHMVNQVENGIDFSFTDCLFDGCGAADGAAVVFDNGHVPANFGKVSFARVGVKVEREKVCTFDGMRGVGLTTVSGRLAVTRKGARDRERFELADFAAKNKPQPELISHFKAREVNFKKLAAREPTAAGGVATAVIRERLTFLQRVEKAGVYPIRFRTRRIRHFEGPSSGTVLLRDAAGTDLGTFDLLGDDFTYMLKAGGPNLYRFEVKTKGAVSVESALPGNGILCEDGVHLFGGKDLAFHFSVPAAATEVLAEIAPQEPASARLLDPEGKVVDEMPYQGGSMVLKALRKPTKADEVWTLAMPKVREDCFIRVGGDALPVLTETRAAVLVER